MRSTSVRSAGIAVEISGAWAMPAGEDSGSLPLRFDDGRLGSCPRDDRMAAGDRIYQVLYRGHLVADHVGVDFHDVSSGCDRLLCRPDLRRPASVFLKMAAAPAFVLAVLMAVLVSGAGGPALPAAFIAVLAAGAIPGALALSDRTSVRRHNRHVAHALSSARRAAGAVIEQDVAAWKERLLAALPSVTGNAGNAVVRGVSCRIVEGTASIGGERSVILRPGRPVPLPDEAVRRCRLEDGDLVHALIPAGRIPACPIAVSSPVSGALWTDGHLASGRDGAPHRADMRAALGRAAWQMVTRQWDELGNRRRARRA